MATSVTPKGREVEVTPGKDPTGYNRPYTVIKFKGVRVAGFAEDDPTGLAAELRTADETIDKTGLK
jgi:hypothetical protein